MNRPFAQTAVAPLPPALAWGGYFLLTLGVAFAALSNESLWIDEALTAVKAQQPTFKDWWAAMAAERGSDLQMPLYMAYMWAYEKLFGSGEWALRAANVPWLVLGVMVWLRAFPRPERPAAALAVLASAFVWFYLNEARPYAMQLSGALMVGAGLKAWHEESSKFQVPNSRFQGSGVSRGWNWTYAFGLILLCGSSLLGMVWGAAAVAALWLVSSRFQVPGSRFQVAGGRWLTVAVAAGLAMLAAYYVWTLQTGARASATAMTDWKNFLFIGYELGGFGGPGPGRLEIREHGFSAFRPHAVGLVLYGAALLWVLIAALRNYAASAERNIAIRGAILAAMPAMVLCAAGVMMHFRLLGRHFTPLAVVLFLLLARGMMALWGGSGFKFQVPGSRFQLPGGIRRLMVVLFVVLSVVSCVMVRFAPRHERDDYRSAAAIAREALAEGKTVWWAAAREGATYYQVPTALSPGEPGHAVWLMNPSETDLAASPAPAFVILSKPDVYDTTGALAKYLGAGGYRQEEQFTAFSVWIGNAEK